MIRKLFTTLAPYIILFSTAFFVYGIIYSNANFSIFTHNWHFTFALQAHTWLQGQLNLQNYYHHLEIAIFNDMYWISFPPLPSILMLPFAAFIGPYYTPDHLFALIVSLFVLMYAYKLALIQLKSRKYAIFFALFLCLATNYLHVALWGAVWHFAQNLAFLFMLMSVYYAVTPNKNHAPLSLFLFCCAMGCRPLQVIYAPLIVYLLYKRSGLTLSAFEKRLPLYGLPALALGGLFLGLNYARFGSIFEFGHNYLPLSMYTPGGQFSIIHMPYNLRTMFFGLPRQLPLLTPIQQRDGAFAFWLASPIVISYAVYFFYSIKNRASYDKEFILVYLVLIPVLIGVHLLLLSAHKCNGGRQFGYRYTIDILVVLFFGLITLLSKFETRTDNTRIYRNLVLLIFGLAVNVMGTIDFIALYHGLR
ncbi:MAG: hypothetical protein FWC77_07500 [Defluviitaleaceae bacterium]|nr:hypothetical protein [Defluviitaleaceae bacterium]